MERPNRLMIQSNSDARSRLRQRMRGATRPILCGRPSGSKSCFEEAKQSTVEEVFEILGHKFPDGNDLESVSRVARELGSLLAAVTCLPTEKLTSEVGDAVIAKLIPLIHHPESQIRTAIFRLFKLSISTPAHVAVLLLENVDYAVLRGLDIPENGTEQQHAFRLASRMLLIYCGSKLYKNDDLVFSFFPRNIIKSVASLAVSALSIPVEALEDEFGQKAPVKKLVEKLAFPALSILNDFAISHPDRILDITGTDWLVKCIIGEGSTLTIATVATQIFMKWMDSAKLREKGQLRLVLQQLFSPIGDLIFFYQNPTTPDGKPAAMPAKTTAMLETFTAVFLSILRSWAGIFACSAIDSKTNEIYSDSPFRMLRFVGTAATTVPVMSQIRGIVAKLCCQFIDAPYAGKNFDSWDSALEFYSTMHLPDEFKTSLRDDFVVSEMDCLIAGGTLFPDVVDCLMSFRAIACAIMLNAGLAEALIRIVLADTDDEKGLTATLLLADLLRTGSSFLPRDTRRTLQAVPSLVQAAFERADLDPQSPHDFHMTFPNSKSASLLLRRLDQANDIYFGREPLKSSLHNINLFLYGGKEPESSDVSFGNRSRSGSTMDVEVRFDCIIAADNGEYFGKVPLTQLCPKKLSSIVECLEAEDGALFSRHKHSEKLHAFCSKMFTLLYPSNNYLVTMDKFSPETMKSIGRLIQVIVPLSKSEPDYSDLLKKFIVECAEQLLPEQLYKGTFSAKNILNTNAHYYFVIIAAIGASTDGVDLLDSAGIFQI
uniref:RICTOR_N domain-containing protein n=1 Tax=Panagrellus redivivus TaxID=6233 RepID=A0A7E4VB44_PANRE